MFRSGGCRARRSGFTLNELLSVTACMMVVATVVLSAAQEVRRQGMLCSCASQLRQVGLLFGMYKEDYYRLPEFSPRNGLGDYSNWAALYAATDPEGEYFCAYASKSKVAGGIASGDLTGDPRLPRLFLRYDATLELLCCPSQGPSPFWKDIGPYYYNTNNPFNTNPLQNWVPLSRRDPSQPLAGCQNPEYLLNNADRGWRHGDRGLDTGINNHLYLDGSVRDLIAPQNWTGK